ncbi:MAG: hypothetical protein ACLGXA_06485 [Acidobacteriota bacterium]
MRYLRHEYILLSASLASALTYFVLRPFAFSLDAAFCAGFSVAVFAYTLRKCGSTFVSGEQAKSVAEITLAHVVCLGALVMILRTGMFVSTLPGWLTVPVVVDTTGRQLGPTGFQILQAMAVFFLGYFEFRVLSDPKSPRDLQKEERKAVVALWKKAGLEAERMDGLRLP